MTARAAPAVRSAPIRPALPRVLRAVHLHQQASRWSEEVHGAPATTTCRRNRTPSWQALSLAHSTRSGTGASVYLGATREAEGEAIARGIRETSSRMRSSVRV